MQRIWKILMILKTNSKILMKSMPKKNREIIIIRQKLPSFYHVFLEYLALHAVSLKKPRAKPVVILKKDSYFFFNHEDKWRQTSDVFRYKWWRQNQPSRNRIFFCSLPFHSWLKLFDFNSYLNDIFEYENYVFWYSRLTVTCVNIFYFLLNRIFVCYMI